MATTPQLVDTFAETPSSSAILLVDDEPSVRSLTARVLRRRDYVVLEATDGADALRVMEGHDGAIALLVTDLMMPGMGGAELAARIVESHPTLRVIYMSGYGEEDLPGHGVDGPVRFLSKPFLPDELVAKVQEALN